MTRPSRIPVLPSKARKSTKATSPTPLKTVPKSDPLPVSPQKPTNSRPVSSRSRIPITAAAHRLETPKPSHAPLSIYRGDAQTLFTLNRFVKRDLQGYISDKYPAFDKVGHELIKPTGKKFVYHLSLTAKDTGATLVTPDVIEAMAAFVEEAEQLEVPQIMVTCPSTAGSVEEYDEDFEDGTEDDTTEISSIEKADEDLEESLCQNHVEHLTSTPAPSQDLSPTSLDAARKARLMRSHTGKSLASLIANADAVSHALIIDAPSDTAEEMKNVEPAMRTTSSQTDAPQQSADSKTKAETNGKPRLVRSQKTNSLAALIAKAASSLETYPDADSDSSSNYSDDSADAYAQEYDPMNYKFIRGYCYDPNFLGHSPCATHLPGGKGKSPDAAIRVTQDRFMDRHYKTTPMRRYKDWCTLKYEFGQEMVHGPSDLRLMKLVNDQVQETRMMWEDEVALPSSSLPSLEIGDESSSFEVDVDDKTSEEPEASGFLEVEDAGVVSEEGSTELDAEIVQVSASLRNVSGLDANNQPQWSSSPFDETVGVYVEPPSTLDVADDTDKVQIAVSVAPVCY